MSAEYPPDDRPPVNYGAVIALMRKRVSQFQAAIDCLEVFERQQGDYRKAWLTWYNRIKQRESRKRRSALAVGVPK